MSSGIGYGQVVSTCYVATYYMTLMAIALRYLFGSFGQTFPWAECAGDWKSECEGNTTATVAEFYFV